MLQELFVSYKPDGQNQLVFLLNNIPKIEHWRRFDSLRAKAITVSIAKKNMTLLMSFNVRWTKDLH